MDDVLSFGRRYLFLTEKSISPFMSILNCFYACVNIKEI